MSAALYFQHEFLNASSTKRAMLVQKACLQNQSNAGIQNLLANVNLNYRPNNDTKQEAQEQRKADNIYFICKMLRAYPDFKFENTGH